MNCINCNNQMSAGSKFCTSCGQQVTEGAVTEVQLAASSQAVATTATTNQFSSQVSEFGNSYWTYVRDVLQTPFHMQRENDLKFGVVNLLLYTLFLSLFFYQVTQMLAGLSEFAPSFSSVFFESFLYIALSQAVVVGVAFLTLKIGSVPVTFSQIVSQYGAFMGVAAGLALLAFIVAVLNVPSLTFILFACVALSANTALLFVIIRFGLQKQAGLNLFFLPIIAQLFIALIAYFFIERTVGIMFQDFLYDPFYF